MTTMFFGETPKVARYDIQTHPIFEKLISEQHSYFWTPQEVDVTKDASDFKKLTPNEQHIFTSNLKRQIVLDTTQGRCPNTAFLPLASIPELETWISTWAFSETMHSRSYTHIIRNIYSNPSEVFDEIMNIDEIAECAEDIERYYNDLMEYNVQHELNPDAPVSYEHKKALWLAINSVNALEGLRFYVSFACSWAFVDLKKVMEGNAKIIKLICRDENLHLGGTVYMIKALPKEDPDFAKISEECKDECLQLYKEVAEQEKSWANYLFKEGSMVGLNEDMLCNYVEFLTNKRLRTIGLPALYDSAPTSDPLPWTQAWIAGGEVQVAPQETEITSYRLGGIKKDVTDTTFNKFKNLKL